MCVLLMFICIYIAYVYIYIYMCVLLMFVYACMYKCICVEFEFVFMDLRGSVFEICTWKHAFCY